MASSLHGLIVIDKPPAVTSARVVATVKRCLGAARVGHTGTLDPDATGVLVCTVGAATRLARFFLAAPKTYRATVHLGIETDTQDAAGRVVATGPVTATETRVRAVARRFEGPIMQVPPVFSALKHRGVPLYRLARSGRPVTKPPRPVTIYQLAVMAVNPPYVELAVTCSAGTYIRTLCADLGTALGCGGHLAALRRTASAGFTLAEAVTLETLADLGRQGQAAERLIGMNAALREMASFTADATLAGRIATGQRLTAVDIHPPDQDGPLKVIDGREHLLAVIEFNPATQRYDYLCGMPYQP